MTACRAIYHFTLYYTVSVKVQYNVISIYSKNDDLLSVLVSPAQTLPPLLIQRGGNATTSTVDNGFN